MDFSLSRPRRAQRFTEFTWIPLLLKVSSPTQSGSRPHNTWQWYFKVGSTPAGANASVPPTYPATMPEL
jgi:hypothetical protein